MRSSGLLLSNALVRAILAPCCAACDAPLDAPLDGLVCDACARGWPAPPAPACVRCGDGLRPGWRSGIDPDRCERCAAGSTRVALLRSAGTFDGSLRLIVHAMKYRRRRLLAGLVADQMRVACRDVFMGAEALVPVPLHWRRQLARGFNQADDLAIALAHRLRLPVWRALRRRRGGPPQARLSRAQRAAISGAYVLRRRVGLFMSSAALDGRRVVLIDDVVTTGATLDACAAALLEAGAASVSAATAARASAAPPTRQPPAPRLSLVPRR
jgi:ComF family protein